MKIFYIYIYLDPRKPGSYKYKELEFEHEPIYVGKGKGDRYKVHLNGNQFNEQFENEIKKISEPIIVKYKENLEEFMALDLETTLIKKIGRKDLNVGPLLNLTNGGDGISGYKHSEAIKQQISDSKKGKKLSEEHKQNLSKSLKGRISPFKGKFHKEETKQRMRKPKSEEHKRKISKNSARSKSCIVHGKEFTSLKEANIYYGYSTNNRNYYKLKKHHKIEFINRRNNVEETI